MVNAPRRTGFADDENGQVVDGRGEPVPEPLGEHLGRGVLESGYLVEMGPVEDRVALGQVMFQPVQIPGGDLDGEAVAMYPAAFMTLLLPRSTP